MPSHKNQKNFVTNITLGNIVFNMSFEEVLENIFYEGRELLQGLRHIHGWNDSTVIGICLACGQSLG